METPFDSGGISIQAFIPVGSNNPLEGRWSNKQWDSERFAGHSIKSSGMVDWSLHALLPVSQEGRIILAWQPRANISLHSTRKQSSLEDTIVAGQSTLALNGGLRSSQNITGNWNTLRLGYQIQPSARVLIGFAMERHSAELSADGSLQGELTADLRSPGASGDTLDWQNLHVDYSQNDFQSNWSGYYQGSSWAASITARAGPVYYEGHMGVKIPLRGHFSLGQRVPYLLDGKLISIEVPDSAWSDAAQWDSLAEHYTQIDSFSTTENMSLQIPQSHTLGIHCTSWLALDYTWLGGTTKLQAKPDTTDSANTTYDLRNWITRSFNPNHLAMLHVSTQRWNLDVGSYWTSGYIPTPVLSGTVQKEALHALWSLRIDALPWIRLFAGVEYAL